MKKSRNNPFWKKPSTIRRNGPVDRLLLFTIVGLMIFGCLMVYSASAPYAQSAYGDSRYFLIRNLIFAAVGLCVMLITAQIDYRVYQKHAFGLYLLSFLLCLAVFVPGLGEEINDAHRWISVGPISIMPADYMKIGSVIFLSAFLARSKPEKNGTLGVLFLVLGFVVFSILPIYIQPNFSAVVVVSASLMIVYFLGGMNAKHLLILLALAVVAGIIVFWPYEGNYRLERLLIVFDPHRDPQGDGWQLLQSLYAVASGRFFGVGFGKGSQKFDYLAEEPHNDFIFSVICEELGFLGAMLVIAAFAFIVYRCFRIARDVRTPFGRLLAYGLTGTIAFQSLVNIGVAIGVVPPTGITLPFVSYGGSSLVAMNVIAGILLNMSRDRV